MRQNALQRVGMKAAYTLRPFIIQPLDGIKSKTGSYHLFYRCTNPLLTVLRKIMPQRILTTRILGDAMLNLARSGYSKPILEIKDIYLVGK